MRLPAFIRCAFGYHELGETRREQIPPHFFIASPTPTRLYRRCVNCRVYREIDYAAEEALKKKVRDDMIDKKWRGKP